MSTKLLTAGLAGGAILLALSDPSENARAAAGKALVERRCGGCHALDVNKEGPRLRGVYDRKAAGLNEFGYSDALRKLGLRWDDASLDRWLSDPDAMAPDTDMAFRVNDTGERKAVVAYLKSLGSR